jgi:hypothetical protein
MQCRRLLKYSYVLSFVMADEVKANKKLTKKQGASTHSVAAAEPQTAKRQMPSKERIPARGPGDRHREAVGGARGRPGGGFERRRI